MSSSTWIGSIDVNSWIATLKKAEIDELNYISQAQLKQYQDTETGLKVQLSVYGQLQGLMDAFKQSMQNVTSAFHTVSYQVSSSDTTVASAQVTNNNVTPGDHNIVVTQRAKAEVKTSMVFTSKNTALNLSTTLQLTVNGNSVNVPVAATDTLENVRDNIKTATANLGVGANILVTSSPVDGSPEYQLVISSNQTGVVNKVTVNDSNNAFQLTETTEAQDAKLTFDGANVVRSTNTINDVLDGLSFTLLKDTGTTTLSISSNVQSRNDAIKTAVHGMVDAYNKIMSLLDQNQAATKTPDSTISVLKSNLTTSMATLFAGTGNYKILADLGISIDTHVPDATTTTADGKKITYTPTGFLTINDATLNSAMTNDFTSFQSFLLDSTNGIMKIVSTSVDLQKTQVSNSTDTQNQHVATINDKITAENSRIATLASQLTKKYDLLQQALTQMQFTSNYLTQQITMMNNKK